MSLNRRLSTYTAQLKDWQIEETLSEQENETVFRISRRDSSGWNYNASLRVLTIMDESDDYSHAGADSLLETVLDQFHSADSIGRSNKIVIPNDFSVCTIRDHNGNAVGYDLLLFTDLLLSLDQLIGEEAFDFSETSIVDLGIDICEALISLHARSILCGEMVPSDIVLKEHHGYRLNKLRACSAPESRQYAPPEGYIDERSDVYSLGLIIYKLLNGNRLPFLTEQCSFGQLTEALRLRKSGEPLPPPCNASPEMSAIVLRACEFDANARYQSAEDMHEELLALHQHAKRRCSTVSHLLQNVFSRIFSFASANKLLFSIICAAIVLYLTAATLLVYSTSSSSDSKSSDSINFRYQIKNDYATITSYIGSSSDIVIPSEIDGVSITRIADEVFMGNSEITSARIDDGIYYVESNLFRNCDNLKSAHFADSVEYIEMGAFSNCSELLEVHYSERLIAVPVYTFANCIKLKSVTGTEAVTQIGDYSFFCCSELEELFLSPEITYIGERAFFQCDKLDSIHIGKNISTIKPGAFVGMDLVSEYTVDPENQYYSVHNGVLYNKDCTELVSCPYGKTGDFVVPDSVLYISADAFNRCLLDSVYISAGVTSIGKEAFTGMINISELVVDPDNEYYCTSDGILYNHDRTTLICCPTGKTGSISIPDGVTAIEAYAFWFSSLDSVVIPESVTSISAGAFTSCSEKLTIYGTSGSAAEVFASENNIGFVECD